MEPLRQKRKLLVDMGKQDEEKVLVSETPKDEWWEVLSHKITGKQASSSQEVDTSKSAFNMSKKTFEYICSLVEKTPVGIVKCSFSNGDAMPLNDRVVVALRRLGTADSLVSIGNALGARHSTVSQLTWRFVEALEEVGLGHIKWPSTEKEMDKIKTKFENIRGLPNCCGAIHTERITLQLSSSHKDADRYWSDSMGRRSMILQVIIDSDPKFREIVVGWPGKVNDQLILQDSSFYKLCQAGDKLNGTTMSLSNFKLREYVVGNSSYPLLPWLMMPHQGTKLLPTKLEFNERLTSTHLVARQALAKLGEDWKIIKGDVWRMDVQKLPLLILACCILHNIVIEMEDSEDIKKHVMSLELDHDPIEDKEVCEYIDKESSALRKKLTKYFSD